MKTPTMCILGTIACLVLGSNIGEAAAGRGNASEGAPHDVYGRPLVDSLGRVDYREDEGAWIVRRADGGFSSSRSTDVVQRPSTRVAGLSSGLDPYSAHPVGSWPEAVAIGDVTGDGRPDVVMTTTFYFDAQNDYCVFVFAQLPDGTLGAPTRFPYLATAARNGIVLADLDENGVLDVVVGHQRGITVLLADGHGSLMPGVVTLDADANTLATTDVDRDGHLDIISLGWSRGATIFYGDGHGGFGHKSPLATNASGYNDLEIGDLTGDGVPDLAVMSGQAYATPNLTVHRHDGVSGFASVPDAYFMGSAASTDGIGLGDVTGDDLSDAVLSCPRNSPTWLWIMSQDSSGRLSGPTTIPSYDIPEPVVVTDVDGDGLKDTVVLHGGWNRLGVYIQQPTGGLGPEALYPVPYASHYAPQGLAVGDFTSDGCADVAFADYNHGLVTLRGTACSEPTPTLLSLVSVNVAPGRVELTWSAPGSDVFRATVYRRTADGDWQAMSPVSADGTGRLVYLDTKVVAGTRYGYRLGVTEAGVEVFLGETNVDVPAGFEFALMGFRANPARDDVWVALSLPDAAPTKLEMFDVTGRRVVSREVGGLGAGSHVLRLADGRTLKPGAYLLRLSRANRSLIARGAVVR